jgi:hypothetical protein
MPTPPRHAPPPRHDGLIRHGRPSRPPECWSGPCARVVCLVKRENHKDALSRAFGSVRTFRIAASKGPSRRTRSVTMAQPWATSSRTPSASARARDRSSTTSRSLGTRRGDDDVEGGARALLSQVGPFSRSAATTSSAKALSDRFRVDPERELNSSRGAIPYGVVPELETSPAALPKRRVPLVAEPIQAIEVHL